MTEKNLEQLAKRLGAEAAERLDVEATAQKVVQRLRDEPAQRPMWIHPTWLRIAAAVVIVVGGAVVASRLTSRADPGAMPRGHAHLVADDLNDLSTDELQAVLASFEDLLRDDGVAVPESTDLRELDAQQLRAVLRTLEG